MPTSQKPRQTTSKDMPGSGMAKDAAKKLEQRKAERKDLMNQLFGKKKK